MQLLLVTGEPVERGEVVAVAGDRQRTTLVIADRSTAGALQLGGERRVKSGGPQVQLEQVQARRFEASPFTSSAAWHLSARWMRDLRSAGNQL